MSATRTYLWDDRPLEADEPSVDNEVDDDPQCAACGVYRSEHSMLGCSDGFVTVEGLRREREAIQRELEMEDHDYRYDGDEDDWDDDPNYDKPDDACAEYPAGYSYAGRSMTE